MKDSHGVPRPASPAKSRSGLSILLVCLCVAVLGLAVTRTGVFGAVTGSGGASGASLVSCVRDPHSPSVVSVDFRQLLVLSESLLKVRRWVAGRWYESGTVSAESVWSDQQPQRLIDSVSHGRSPGGYEMRWWANDNRDDVVADVFLFAGPSQARRFFQDAAAVTCHNSATQPPAHWPSGARNLVWINPDGALQYDVFLRRGRAVFRIVDVPAGSNGGRPSDKPGQVGVAVVDDLACALFYANCPSGSILATPRRALASRLTPIASPISPRTG
jgi:hypothetical protein